MDLEQLKKYFEAKPLPEEIWLDKGVNIVNVTLFVSSHLAVLENLDEVKVFEPFYDRLIRLRELLENSK